jgi:hypothetical protein
MGCSLALAQAVEDTCYRFERFDFDPVLEAIPGSPYPSFITSGGWTPDGQILVVADSFKEKLLVFSPEAKLLKATQEFSSDAAKVNRDVQGLSYMHPGLNGHFFVEDEIDGVILELTSDFELVPGQQTRARWQHEDVENSRRITATWGWQPMKQGFLAFVDLEFTDIKGPDRYKSAFVQFDHSGILQVFGEPIGNSTGVRDYYLRHMIRYLATIDGERGYILSMDAKPSVRSVQLGQDAQQSLPKFPVFQAPVLKRNAEWTRTLQGFRQATAFYKVIEEAEMPTGLYAWADRLYLLVKMAINRTRGTTSWSLIGLDPETGQEVSRVGLPTTAAHLTLIWGETLALIEKKPVEGIGELHSPYMETPSMVLLPVEWVTNPDSGPLSMKARIECSSPR